MPTFSNVTPEQFKAHVGRLWQQMRSGKTADEAALRAKEEEAIKPAADKLGVSLSDVGHYAQALAQWTAAGFPVRKQAEVDRIEAEICRPCEKYVDGRCKECGCRVNTSKLAVANKIKMKTQVCPLGKWK